MLRPRPSLPGPPAPPRASITALPRPEATPLIAAVPPPHAVTPTGCIVRAVVLAGLLGVAVGARGQATPLTKASEIRALSVTQAESGLPVKMRGTVVFIEPATLFVQDETSTTYVRPGEGGPVRVGDVVEFEGKTRMGLFLPGIDTSPYRVVGHETLPPGLPVNYDDLASGRYHYRRVAVEGIVRSVEPHDENRTLLRLAVGSRVLEVRIEAEPERGRELIDARVRISGLAAGLINERRQLVQPYVRVTDWTDLTVLQPAVPLAQVPLISARDLLAFRDTGLVEHRIRIRGTVTAAFPRGTVFLRQNDDAFGVRFPTLPAVRPGDTVELVGFPEMDHYSASVASAQLLERTPGPAPRPLAIASVDDLSGVHDANLIRVEATVLDAFKTASGVTIRLQGRARSIEARLPEGSAVPEPLSRIRLTAVCLVETARRSSNAFVSSADVLSLRAREPEDLVVLQNPSWWTARRLVITLAALGGVTLVTGLWIAVLRRQVRHQTEALRRRIESEAALEERQRIAREFHDSLQQDLTGLGLRLDAAATRALDDKGQRIIQTSRGLLARIQAETRNFVSDLRDATADDGDLAKALESIVAAHHGDGVEVRLEFSAPPPPLPAGTVHHLRMIVRESVANALKHAAPRLVRIVVTAEPGLVIRVTDDGSGFDAATETLGRNGHFGCVGLRERAHKIGANVAWRSAPGAGTTVEIALGAPARVAPSAAAQPAAARA